MEVHQIRDKDPLSTEARKSWLVTTALAIGARFQAKYEAGALEHQGDLGSVGMMELLDHMEQEALDQLAYVREIKRRYGK